MDWFSLKDITRLVEIRNKQLQYQSEVDSLLSERLDMCSKDIATLLLEERKYNQKMNARSTDMSFIGKMKFALYLTTDWESRYKSLENNLKSSSDCDAIRGFIKAYYSSTN